MRLLVRLILLLLVVASLGQACLGRAEPANAVVPDNFSCTGKALDTDKQALISAVQASYSQVESLAANFTQQSRSAGLGDAFEQSSGRIWFARPGKMKWEYEKPEPQTFLLKDKTFWHYRTVDQQVTIGEFDQIFLSELPVSFLLGIGRLGEQFTLIEVCKTPAGLLLKLTPREAKDQETLEEFDLLVDAESKLTLGARIRSIGGNSDSILFSKQQRNIPTSAATFADNFPRGVFTDDRRKIRETKIEERTIN